MDLKQAFVLSRILNLGASVLGFNKQYITYQRPTKKYRTKAEAKAKRRMQNESRRINRAILRVA